MAALRVNAERFHSVTGKGYRPRPSTLGAGAGSRRIIIVNFCVVLLCRC